MKRFMDMFKKDWVFCLALTIIIVTVWALRTG